MCEAERRKAGAASSKIKQFEHLGAKKPRGDGYVDFSFTSLFLRPKDTDAGKMTLQNYNWAECCAHPTVLRLKI